MLMQRQGGDDCETNAVTDCKLYIFSETTYASHYLLKFDICSDMYSD